jgi:hypothetical protein
MATAPADMRNGTHHMFLYMFGWLPASSGRYCHDRCYHHQPFDVPPDVGIFFYNGHHQKELRKYN